MIGGAASSMLGGTSPVDGPGHRHRIQKNIPPNIEEAAQPIISVAIDAAKKGTSWRPDRHVDEISATNVSI